MSLRCFGKIGVILLFSCLSATAQAEWLSTQQIVNSSQQPVDFIHQSLQQKEVQQALLEHGVDAAKIEKHLASMTREEIDTLNQQLHDAPAGGDGGTVATVLIIIALLEILGITDLLTFM